MNYSFASMKSLKDVYNRIKNPTHLITESLNEVRITSSFDHLVQPSTQQAIQNACANYGGIDNVTIVWTNQNTDYAPTYDVYETGTDERYLFSIDTDGDVIYER